MTGNIENKTSKTSSSIDWYEINRKIFHIIGGLIISTLIYFDILKAWMVLIALVLGIITSIIYTKYDLPIIDFFLKKFEREHLRKKFPGKGTIYLGIAVLLLIITFEKNIAIAGLLIWTFGDSISAIVGKHYGTIKHPLNSSRQIEGTLAGIVAGFIAASFFAYWLYALIASTIAMIVESADWKLYQEAFDDNFFVPVVGASVIYLLMIIF